MAPPVLSPSLVPSLSPSFNPSENPNGTTDINPSLVPSLNPSSNPSESPSCLSEYECMRLRKIKRNEARLAELELLVPLAPRTKTNRSKHVAMQDDVVRRVQPKRNVKTPYLVTRRILMRTLSSARERIQSIRPTQERRTLSARECITSITRTKRSTAPAALIMMTRTTRRS